MTIRVGRIASGMTAEDHRLAAQAGITHSGPLVTVGGVAGGLDFAKTTGMSATIGVGQAWVPGTSAADQGGYPVTLDAAEAISFGVGDATRDRIDLVVLQVRDNPYDSSGVQAGRVLVVPGAYPVSGGPVAPAVPASAIALFTQRVNHGTSVGSGGIDVTLTVDVRVHVTAAGGPVNVHNQAERDALSPIYDGLTVYRLDLHTTERWNGTSWSTPTSRRHDGTAAVVTVTPANTTVPVTNWNAATYNVGDITYAAGVFTVHTPGIYRWEATVLWPSSLTAYRVEQFVLINGVANAGGQQSMNFANGFGQQFVSSGFTLQLAAGDTVELGMQASTSGVTGVQPEAFALTRVA